MHQRMHYPQLPTNKKNPSPEELKKRRQQNAAHADLKFLTQFDGELRSREYCVSLKGVSGNRATCVMEPWCQKHNVVSCTPFASGAKTAKLGKEDYVLFCVKFNPHDWSVESLIRDVFCRRQYFVVIGNFEMNDMILGLSSFDGKRIDQRQVKRYVQDKFGLQENEQIVLVSTKVERLNKQQQKEAATPPHPPIAKSEDVQCLKKEAKELFGNSFENIDEPTEQSPEFQSSIEYRDFPPALPKAVSNDGGENEDSRSTEQPPIFHSTALLACYNYHRIFKISELQMIRFVYPHDDNALFSIFGPQRFRYDPYRNPAFRVAESSKSKKDDI